MYVNDHIKCPLLLSDFNQKPEYVYTFYLKIICVAGSRCFVHTSEKWTDKHDESESLYAGAFQNRLTNTLSTNLT
jgi:hypothetical protein